MTDSDDEATEAALKSELGGALERLRADAAVRGGDADADVSLVTTLAELGAEWLARARTEHGVIQVILPKATDRVRFMKGQIEVMAEGEDAITVRALGGAIAVEPRVDNVIRVRLR